MEEKKMTTLQNKKQKQNKKIKKNIKKFYYNYRGQ